MTTNDDVEVKFGKVLKKLRLEAGYTQESLAHEANLERTHISMLERGHRCPTLKTLIQIATALNISLTELVAAFER
jgi:transcriptional regulator with XRE-family HTH domain